MSSTTKRLLRNFALEILIYSILLAIYFATVLRLVEEPITRLFNQSPWVYALAGLLLIVVQAVLLESITSFLINRLGLEKLE